jgi:hypothetical protein
MKQNPSWEADISSADQKITTFMELENILSWS